MKGCPKQRWLIRLFKKLLLRVTITMTENLKKTKSFKKNGLLESGKKFNK